MYFPEFMAENDWSAQDCISLDGIPYIGRLVSADSNVFVVATGFNKWGMTSAMVSANMISDMICGNNAYENSIFLLPVFVFLLLPKLYFKMQQKRLPVFQSIYAVQSLRQVI